MKTKLEALREQHLALAVQEKAARLVRLYGGDPATCATARMADAHACAIDPLYWIASWGVIRNEHAGRVELMDTPFMLWPRQVEVVRWVLDILIPDNRLGLIVKSKEIGISWLLLHIAYHGWRFRGWSTLLGSRMEDLVDRTGDMDSLFEKLRYIHRAQPPHLQERRVIDNHLIFHNLRAQTKITGQRTSADFGRGGRGRLAIVDEYPAIPNRIQEAIVRSSESYGARVFLGNPAGDRTYEYQLFQKLAAELVLELPWESDPYRDEEWRRSKLLEFGGALTVEQFNREYSAQHVSLGTTSYIFRFREDVLGYDETTAEWRRVREAARATWFHAGGWDYGSGPSLLANVDCLVDYGANGARPELWFDFEAVFQQTDWRTAGATVRDGIRAYGGRCLHFGDPAGEQKDSAQTSWALNLQTAGIPLVSLVEWYNSKDGKEWAIKTAQAMIDEDRIHVHRAKCPVLLESLKKWRRDVEDWVDIALLSRTYIPPRKDRYSHVCEAFLYAVAGVMFYASQASGGELEHSVPARVQDSMSAVFAGVRRGW